MVRRLSRRSLGAFLLPFPNDEDEIPMRMSIGVGLDTAMNARAWTPARLPSGVALTWLEGTLADLGSTDAGTGGVDGLSDSSTVGYWTDRAAGKHLKQATSGARPIAGYSALGRGVAVHGDGAARYLAAASTIAGARHVFADVCFRGGNDVRGAGDEPNNFQGQYQSYVAGDAIANPSSALLVGNVSTNNLLDSSNLAGSYYKNGVLTSPANVGRQRVWQVARFSRNTEMDTGNLRVLTYPTNILWAQGAIRRLVVLHSSATAAQISNVQAYMLRMARGTPVIACSIDSLSACLGLAQNEAWPHLLWRNRYRGCVSVPNLGIPDRTLTTATADDPATLDSVAGTGRNILVLNGGVNDVLGGADAATAWSRLQAYITMATARGWQVVVCAPADGTGYSGAHRAVLSTLRGLIAAGHVAAGCAGYVDLWAAAPALLGDGIHYSTAGAITVADAVGVVVDTLL